MAHTWDESEPELAGSTWWRFVRHLVDASLRARISQISASVAYYGFLSLFPAMIAVVSTLGLLADPALVERRLESLNDLMPPGASELLTSQLHGIMKTAPTSLGLGIVASLLGALWGATNGTASLVRALNVAYGVPDRRGYLRNRGVGLLLLLGSLLVVVLVAGLLYGLPRLDSWTAVPTWLAEPLRWLRWVAAAAITSGALATAYRTVPCRSSSTWRGVWLGSSVATVGWLAATALFSLYVSSFGKLQATYGALTGVIVLMLWLYLTAVALLVGAEVDSAVEWVEGGLESRPRDTPQGEQGQRAQGESCQGS